MDEWPAIEKINRIRFRAMDILPFRVYHILSSSPAVSNINPPITDMKVMPVFTLVAGQGPLDDATLTHTMSHSAKGVGFAHYTLSIAKNDPYLDFSNLTMVPSDDSPLFDRTTIRNALAFSSAANAWASAYRIFLNFHRILTYICRAPALFASAPETTLFGQRVSVGDGGFFDNTGLLGLLRNTPDIEEMEIVYVTREGPDLESLKYLPIAFEEIDPMQTNRVKRDRMGFFWTDTRKSVAHAKLRGRVGPNAFGIAEERTFILILISVWAPQFGLVPVIRKRYLEGGQYSTLMQTILSYFIKHNIIASLSSDDLYIAIGGGGVITMCAGAPILHFLRAMKKRIVLGSGISGGSWAFAFASYVKPESIIETAPLLCANEIVTKLNEQLFHMWENISERVSDTVFQMKSLPAFLSVSALYECNWERYIHDIFKDRFLQPPLCPFVITWCLMARAWQALDTPIPPAPVTVVT